MSDPLLHVQQDFAIRLKSAAVLQSVPIFSDVPRDREDAAMIQQGIQRALAGIDSDNGRIGLAILIPMPDFEVEKPDVPGVCGQAILKVQVLERVMFNEGGRGIGMTCETVAWAVAKHGHQLQLKPNQVVYATKMEMIDAREAGEELGSPDVAWEVEFRLRADVDGYECCDLPRIVYDSDTGLVTITTPTAGGKIHVTTDGTYPGSANPAAIVYDEPFTAPASGSCVRAVTTKPGLADSGADEITIP